MLERLENIFVEQNEDLERDQYYMSLFQNQHYAYGASSKISSCFLRKYQHLL